MEELQGSIAIDVARAKTGSNRHAAVATESEASDEGSDAEASISAGGPGDLRVTGPEADGSEVESGAETIVDSGADAMDDDGQDADAELATADGPAPGNELSDDELLHAIAALVYASPEPLSERRLIALLEGPLPARVQGALGTLKMRLAESGLPLELVAIAGGWQIVTAQQMAETVQRLFKARKTERVSPAALETLAVIAYRQPVTKAEIEAIRGVQVGPILRTLVDRGLLRVTGRADVPGHPLQYGTTRMFLERFGLSGIEDLPRDSELAKG